MAQRVISSVIDDLTGEEDAATTLFSLDGAEYEIDLTDENRERLAAALQEYIDNARRTGGRLKSPAGTKKTTSRDPAQLQHMREWGREHGFTVSDRGRLPAALEDAYQTWQEEKAATAKPAAKRKRTPAKATKASV